MKKRRAPLPWLLVPVLATLGLLLTSASHDHEGAPWWEQADDQATQALTEILGSSPAEWSFSDKGHIETVAGRKTLTNGEKPLTLNSATTYGTNLEYTITFRVTATPDQPSGLAFHVGVTNGAPHTPPGVAFNTSSNTPYAGCYVYGPTNTCAAINYYYPKAVSTRSLSWPETLRKSVERDLASLPAINEQWHTYRLVVRNNHLETWFDDRLQNIRSKDICDYTGQVRINLSQNIALASFRVKPISAEKPIHRPIPISGYVNASQLNGGQINHASLPAPNETVLVKGIPFIFPETNERGQDHISLANSWAQFSALEGYFESHYGEFGGRWPVTFSVNPARIQMRIPYDNYTRLYFIAAADDSENSVPVVTAQFYREASGFPKSFSGRVPLFTARSSEVTALPVKLEGGRPGSLYLITIPLDPGQLSDFSDLGVLDVELTKEVKHYRSYPDPICFSYHQGGLPSSVHVYAMTMERSPIAMDFKPDQFAHVWTAPAKPSYTVTLRNRTSVARPVELELSTLSHDGTEPTTQKQTVTVPPGNTDMPVKFAINDLKKFGYHDVTLTLKDGDQAWVEKRALAQLPTDTRERGNWDEGHGPLFGMFDWGGGHTTPKRIDTLPLLGQAGAETTLGSFEGASPEERGLAEKYGMFTLYFFDAATIYYNAFVSPKELAEKYDPAKPDESAAALVDFLRKLETKPSSVTRPVEVPFFPEPNIGPISYGNLPDYYGEPEYKLTDDEEKTYQVYLTKFLIGAKAIRKNWPTAKLMLPHGDPLFCIPFIRRNAEVRELMDGVALDMPGFERMPEMQLHSVCHHRLYELVNEFKKIGKIPRLSVHEGTCADTPPGALSYDDQADIYARNFLIYFAYGVTRHPSGPSSFDCGNYWGEEHYGCCGLFTHLPCAAPKPSYVAYATLTRHLNRANFEKWLPTGSLTTYCLQFKHYKTNKLIHVLWTLRGKRPVTLNVPRGAKVTRFDEDDNSTELTETDGRVSFTMDSSPCYIEGLEADAQITLGEPDHSDSKPAPISTKIGNPGDGSWKSSSQPDKDYEDNYYLQIARFPGKMKATTEDVPAEYGGKALSVHLGQQEKERRLMPWYTTILPDHPITISGKSSHLGIWVKAASDWGRVVYFLRDAKGEKWMSIGSKESWNCDDTHSWSCFNFDGWRYLRFETPANSGYDSFRETGSTWWGHAGPGDGIVDLPVSLEKIIVERRTHVMYVNDPQPARPDDILLGDLYAEYASPHDKTEDAVRESRIRMPMPTGFPDVGNPIKDMAAKGVGAAPAAIKRVEPPAHEYDGTRCLVHFDKAPGAAGYNIWVSPYEDGNGALEMAKDWKESGQLLTGLHPEVDFYLFLVYTDAEGRLSKPSKPFKIRLRDMFANK